MSPTSYLLFHRSGGLWGIDSGQVLRIGPGRSAGSAPNSTAVNGEALRVELAGSALAADRVEGVFADLSVRPLSGTVRSFWPEQGLGVALYQGRPVVLLDPLHLPLPLVASGGPDA